MYIDKELKFSDAQALTVTAVSTNVVDLGVDRDIGMGEPMAAVVTIGVAADYTTTDETYQFALQTSVDEAFSSPVVVVSSAVINGDELPAGAKVVLPVGHSNLRYLRINNTLAGTTPTVTVDAQLMPMSMIDGYTIYADGYDIT